MAARHMAGGIPRDWHTENPQKGVRSYRGRHFKEMPAEEAANVEEPISQMPAMDATSRAGRSNDSDAATSEARAFIEEILRELQLEFEPRRVEPQPRPESTPAVEPEPERAPEPAPESAVEPEPIPEPEPELAPEPEPEPTLSPAKTVDTTLVPTLDDVPSAETVGSEDEFDRDGLQSTQQLNRLTAEEWVDELESTLQMRPLTEEDIDELEATLPIDHEKVREALRKVMPVAGETSDHLEVTEQLPNVGERSEQPSNAGSTLGRSESVPVIRFEANALVRKDDDWREGTSQRSATRRERRPFSFLAAIGARVSKLLHLDDR
ncbi:MAG: hypothetical protein IKG22_15145 [Atopobiaceae bacterium]|nr:hypothetical protein [Atopobiaceae bacterium]